MSAHARRIPRSPGSLAGSRLQIGMRRNRSWQREPVSRASAPDPSRADPHWILRPDVADGLDVVAALGLPFDVVAVFRTTSSCSRPSADGIRTSCSSSIIWRSRHIGPMAGRPGPRNCARPLAARRVREDLGLNTAAGPGWTPDELRPGFDIALEAFAPQRLLFGSDWPVCRLASTYAEVVAAARALIGGLAADEQAEILGGTAARVYGLGPAG